MRQPESHSNTPIDWHTGQMLRTVWPLQCVAALLLLLPIAALIIIWPIPSLGISVDLGTGEILSVAPSSIADAGGLIVGDRIVAIYSHEWATRTDELFQIPLAWSEVLVIPITIDRHDKQYDFQLQPREPDLPFQAEKAIGFILGAICWLTGYLLGVVRRHEAPGALLAFP